LQTGDVLLQVGNTPVHLKIFGDPDGTFHDFGSDFYIIQAFPLRTNQFVQTATFRTGHLFSPEDRIPRKIFFDMNKPAPDRLPIIVGTAKPYRKLLDFVITKARDFNYLRR